MGAARTTIWTVADRPNRGENNDAVTLVIQSAGFVVYFGVESVVAPLIRCPCCGYKTLQAPNAMGLCPVCGWEDDGQEDADAAEVRLTANGQLSLARARSYFTQIGAAHPRFLPYVRKPQVTER